MKYHRLIGINEPDDGMTRDKAHKYEGLCLHCSGLLPEHAPPNSYPRQGFCSRECYEGWKGEEDE